MSGPRTETFSLLGGEAPTTGLFDGVATTWTARYPGPGAEIDALAKTALTAFDQKNLAANVPALLALRAKLATLPLDPLVTDKRAQLDRVLQACLGLRVATTIAAPDAVPGETLELTHTVTSVVPVRWLATRTASNANLTPPTTKASDLVDLKPNQPVTRTSSLTLPASTPLTTPTGSAPRAAPASPASMTPPSSATPKTSRPSRSNSSSKSAANNS